ncbi:CvpA family protein [Flavobacterium sp.]|uniref:CvpA family protein n=1 Tax=Flavobacterium sp. TaxID=239 RepID=UPI002CB8BF11|nr:CvpA family protein [Flavobacterium sp.]HSD07828.1 CvpA family protein [Flavobacterium sp.]
MSFFDIIVGLLLCYSLYKGIRNGLFVELASFLSLILGIYIAIKFSDILKNVLSGWLHWNPYTIQIIAFILTFIIVVIIIYMLGKLFTNLADFAFLGWINTIGGGFFRVLKTILIISIFLTLFQKINYHNYLAKKETLDKTIFFNPIQKIAGFVFPSIEKWYDKARK